LGTDWISIQPDLSRRCPIVDPDDHHLVVSLGCAVENLVQAALAHGLHAQVEQENGGDAIRIALEPTRADATALFQAIPERQNSRAEYDGKSVAPAILQKLEDVAREDGVDLMLLTDRRVMQEVGDIVLDANAMQVKDPAFVAELKSWTRFGYDEFVEAGDGLFSRCVGNPALPQWLGRKLFGMVFTADKENKKYAAQIKSSGGMAIFLSPGQDRAQWVKVGRSYERFALEATTRDIRTAFLNQPVEVAEVRPQLASYLRVGNLRPDLIVRFGHGPHMPRSLRRPVEDVIR
jgi:hypothetical protein